MNLLLKDKIIVVQIKKYINYKIFNIGLVAAYKSKYF